MMRKLKPWARTTIAVVALLLVGLVAFLITWALAGGDDHHESSPPPQQPSPTQPLSEDQQSRDPSYTVRVCNIVNGQYLDSVKQAKSLDKSLYGYYQGVKNENGIIAGFLEDLHDDPSDIKWLNHLLTDEISKECP